jgi:hypothetical protein
MGILRYSASADTSLTNAFEANLTTRGTGSNMGYADALEVFSIYGQESGSATGQSQELSRILIQFPVSEISADRTAGTIPASGSISFYLKMYNAQQPFTLPQDFNLVVAPVSRSWSEGRGLDMDEYQDLGTSNWMKANDNTDWTSIGGDYRTGSNFNVSFPLGYEDLELDVSAVIEKWIAGSDPAFASNYGFGIRLTASQEAYFSSSTGQDTSVLINNLDGATESYYTKQFFARSTEFFYKRPLIEARWDSSLKDNRENFFYSSSLAPSADNLNTLYLYNYIRGRLVDIPGSPTIRVSLLSGSTSPETGSAVQLYGESGGDGTTSHSASAGRVSTGIYSASMAVTAAATPLTALYDVWSSADDTTIEYFTGSIYPQKMPTYMGAPTFSRVTNIKNMHKSYSPVDIARFRLFIRDKNWSPTIYTRATSVNPTDIIESGAYSVRRVTDGLNVIPFGTGSDLHTMMSYDVSGNYFDLNMSLLDSGYMYAIHLAYYNDSVSSWIEQPYTFKFRVD